MNDDITMLPLLAKFKSELSLEVDVKEFSKIRDAILKTNIGKSEQFKLCIAAEEIFVNICSYAYEGKEKTDQKIIFELEQSDKITMRFTDCGIPYDPREGVIKADDYDIFLKEGGLGKLIAFTVTDEAAYEYTDGKNILTLTKYIKENLYDN